jgi:hypothetical protein
MIRRFSHPPPAERQRPGPLSLLVVSLLVVGCSSPRGTSGSASGDEGPQVGNCTVSLTQEPDGFFASIDYHYGVGGRINTVEAIFDDGSSTTTEYQYDEDSRLERVSGWFGLGQATSTYSYDSEGRIDIIEYDTDEDEVIDYTFGHSYDNQGFLTRLESPPPADLTFREDYSYDGDGWLELTTYSDWSDDGQEWSLIEERESGYDAAGCLIETLTVEADGDESLIVHGHDSEGRLALEEYDNENAGVIDSENRFDYGDGAGCSPINAGYPTYQGQFQRGFPSYVCP